MLPLRILVLLLTTGSFAALAATQTALPISPAGPGDARDRTGSPDFPLLAASPQQDISGRYQSVITTKRGKRRAVVTLEQDGDTLVATWEGRPADRLVGIRDGDRIEFEWYNSRAGYDLVGFWTVMPSGDRIEGRWERPDGASGGEWTLTRIE